MLQGTYCSKPDISIFDREWNGKCYHSPSVSNHSRGVAILLSMTLCSSDKFKIEKVDPDTEGRKIMLTLTLHDKR